MQCPNCRDEVYDTDDRCMSCGHDLTKARPSRQRSSASSSRRKTSDRKPSRPSVVPKLIFWLILAGIAGGIWWHQKSEAEAQAAAAQQAIEQGKEFYNAGRYSEAIESFQKARELGAEGTSELIQQCSQRVAEAEAAQRRAKPFPLDEAAKSLASAALPDFKSVVAEFAKEGIRFDPMLTVNVTQVAGDTQYNCQGWVSAFDIDMCFDWNGYYRHRAGEGVGGWELLDLYITSICDNDPEPVWMGYQWQHSETVF